MAATATAENIAVTDTKPAEVATEPAKPAEQTPATEKPAEKPAEPKADEPTVEPAKPEAAQAEQPKPPEKYDLTLPDGADTWLDQADVTHIEALAKTNGWTKEQAQSALEQHVDALATQSQAFRTATEADPIYGGDHLERTQTLARRALDRVRPAGTPHGDALRSLLTKTGYGNHLEVVSLLADLGTLMAEDSPTSSGSGGGVATKTAAEILYPNMAKE
jgi:outer membrane biosynthesis protein TonB